MSGLSDRELRERIIRDPRAGWRAFVDQYSPRLLQLIDQCGVRDRDDAMDLYVHICERLAADDCARLRRHDPAKGALSAWLSTVVRRMLVDWVRADQGRKRLFGSLKALSPVDQRVFELYYWRRHTPAEMASLILDDAGRGIGISAVFASLERVERALTERQRADLITLAARNHDAVGLEDEEGEPVIALVSSAPGPEAAIIAAQDQHALDVALATLDAEDRVIICMRFLDGLTLPEIKRALHLDSLPPERISNIIAALRMQLEHRKEELA
jgi:DNA-directed RNA polymerase specialized sigma24 family protein